MIKAMEAQYSALALMSGLRIWTNIIFTAEGKIHMAAEQQTANRLDL